MGFAALYDRVTGEHLFEPGASDALLFTGGQMNMRILLPDGRRK